MWLRRLLWADGGTLALALETKGRGCWPRTMVVFVCLFVCVSVTRLREPRLPCIADVRVLLVGPGVGRVVGADAGRGPARLMAQRAEGLACFRGSCLLTCQLHTERDVAVSVSRLRD